MAPSGAVLTSPWVVMWMISTSEPPWRNWSATQWACHKARALARVPKRIVGMKVVSRLLAGCREAWVWFTLGSPFDAFPQEATMMQRLLSSLAVLLAIASIVPAQTRDEKVRGDRSEIEGDGHWIYN